MKSIFPIWTLLTIGSFAPPIYANVTVNVISTGFGVVVLEKPIPRDFFVQLEGEKLTVDNMASNLWLRWADGSASAIDKDVNQLLDNDLIKVYTMSSTSPVLTPGEREGPATIVTLSTPPFAVDDWSLKAGEIQEKADLVVAFHQRYGTGTPGDKLEYYRKASVFSDKTRSKAEKRAARIYAEVKPAPPLRPAAAKPAKIILPITLIQPGLKPTQIQLISKPTDIQKTTTPTQIPLGNYNYDLETIGALDRPNELTVAEGQGLDLFALAQRQFGKGAVAAVELMCYNGFTSTITAPNQGLLLIPPDGDFTNALAAAEIIYASKEKPEIVALRTSGQSPCESASGVLTVNVLLR